VQNLGYRKRRSAVRARAALVWSLALFVAIQLGIHLWFTTDRELGDPEFGRKLSDLQAALAENPGCPLILTLGSSRMATAFRPEVLPWPPGPGGRTPVAFNFAIVGSGPEMSHLVLHRLLAVGIRPAWVLVEYWPPFWTTQRSLHDFRGQIDIGRLDVSALRLLGGYLARPQYLYRAWMEARLAPVYTYRSALLDRFAAAVGAGTPATNVTVHNLDISGWWSPRTEHLPEYDASVRSSTLAHYRPRLQRYAARVIPDRALRATLELCRRNQIRATVVFLPEGDEFRRCYPETVLSNIDGYLRRVERECGANVVDARRWIEESAFVDSHHLFPEGATVFTRRLGQEILIPQLARQSAPRRDLR
jgi:hypothetical protein